MKKIAICSAILAAVVLILKRLKPLPRIELDPHSRSHSGSFKQAPARTGILTQIGAAMGNDQTVRRSSLTPDERGIVSDIENTLARQRAEREARGSSLTPGERAILEDIEEQLDDGNLSGGLTDDERALLDDMESQLSDEETQTHGRLSDS